jgi:glycerol-3-phosphate dehydrogenase (NAD(P)+)
LADALAEIGQVAEGVETSHAAMALSGRNGVKMPVFEAIHRVLRGEIAPMEAVSLLMERDTPYEGGWF